MRFNRRTPSLVSPPLVPVLGLDEVKATLRIDGTADDVILQLYIDAAIDAAQQYCRRSFITQGRKLIMDGFSACDGDDKMAAMGAGVFNVPSFVFYSMADSVDLPYGPVQSITSIKTYDTDNVETIYPDADYIIAADRITLNMGKMWPINLRSRAAVIIEYKAGYGNTADSVPGAIRQGIMAHVQQMYECRGVCDASDACKRMFDGYKLFDEMGVL